MPDAFIIEVSGITAGIIANERKRFRFHASHFAMRSLEGQTFKGPRDAERAAARIAAEKFKDRFDESRTCCRPLF